MWYQPWLTETTGRYSCPGADRCEFSRTEHDTRGSGMERLTMKIISPMAADETGECRLPYIWYIVGERTSLNAPLSFRTEGASKSMPKTNVIKLILTSLSMAMTYH